MGSIAISRRARAAELAPFGQPKPLARVAFASGNRRKDPLSTLACRLFWPNSILRPLIFVTFRLGDLPQELNAMQFYDLIMLAVLGLAVFFGYWKGFAWQLASLTAIIVSYMVARNFNEPVAKMIGGDPSWNRFLAMFILFTGTSLLIWLGFGFVKGTIEKLHLKGFDRQFGAVLGFVKGFIICTLITLFAVSLLTSNMARRMKRRLFSLTGSGSASGTEMGSAPTRLINCGLIFLPVAKRALITASCSGEHKTKP